MAAEVKKETKLEIPHVFFIDLTGYSRLLATEQGKFLQHLNEAVRPAKCEHG